MAKKPPTKAKILKRLAKKLKVPCTDISASKVKNQEFSEPHYPNKLDYFIEGQTKLALEKLQRRLDLIDSRVKDIEKIAGDAVYEERFKHHMGGWESAGYPISEFIKGRRYRYTPSKKGTYFDRGGVMDRVVGKPFVTCVDGHIDTAKFDATGEVYLVWDPKDFIDVTDSTQPAEPWWKPLGFEKEPQKGDVVEFTSGYEWPPFPHIGRFAELNRKGALNPYICLTIQGGLGPAYYHMRPLKSTTQNKDDWWTPLGFKQEPRIGAVVYAADHTKTERFKGVLEKPRTNEGTFFVRDDIDDEIFQYDYIFPTDRKKT